MAGLEALGAALKKVGETTFKEGVKKGLEGLKEGKSLSEALKGSIDTMKETGFKEINNFLSPENAEKLNDSSDKLNEIQDKIEFEPQYFSENQTEIVNDFKDATENINEVAKDLNENLNQLEGKGITDVMKEELDKFKDILDQIKEIQDKLKELGVNPDMLSMLNSDASEIDDMEDVESTE